ncbi:hypothetical protein D9M69_508550 [compost metagenome]
MSRRTGRQRCGDGVHPYPQAGKLSRQGAGQEHNRSAGRTDHGFARCRDARSICRDQHYFSIALVTHVLDRRVHSVEARHQTALQGCDALLRSHVDEQFRTRLAWPTTRHHHVYLAKVLLGKADSLIDPVISEQVAFHEDTCPWMVSAFFDQATRSFVVTSLDDDIGTAASHHPNALAANTLGPAEYDSNHPGHICDHCTSSLALLGAAS